MIKIKLCLTIAILHTVSIVVVPQQTPPSDRHMIFSGEVVEVGPSPGFGSGGVTVYQLVKYRVLHVCKGTYRGKEIVADHLILDPTEFNNLRIGQKVCVGVTKANQITPRYNDDMIRKTSDAIETYYIVHDIFIRNCQCWPED